MQLVQLLRALDPFSPPNLQSLISNLPAFEITRVTDKSRSVIPNTLFVAYPGVNVDGAQFVPDAIQRGAVAIVTQSPISGLQSPVPVIRVPDGRAALAHLSAAFYSFPTRNLRVIGVTGTDGKTTTSTLIENILLSAGHTVGTITTVAAHIAGQEVDTGFHTTTPDAPDIQNYLAQMVERGTEYAVVESTSHGLAQHRLDAIDFDIAVVTNITHEHLDLHGSWENYRDSKALLFRALESAHRKPRTKKVAVLNADDNSRGVFDFLRAIPADEKVIYHRSQVQNHVSETANELWLSARDIIHTADGLHFSISTPFGELEIESPLIGLYNVSNILAATGTAIGRRIPFDAITQGIKITHGIVGRMERISSDRAFTVIIDFAHTPNALENALKTARELAGQFRSNTSASSHSFTINPLQTGSTNAPGRVICIFGCAGLRDIQKRAWMGEISGTLADITILTAEDPRTESLAQINSQVAEGLHKAIRKQDLDYFIIEDRAQAIDYAINHLAEPNDVVIICGKGHERSMCFGTTEYPWSDQDAARQALNHLS